MKKKIRNWIIFSLVLGYFIFFFPLSLTRDFFGNLFGDTENTTFEERAKMTRTGIKMLEKIKSDAKSGNYTPEKYFRDIDKLEFYEYKYNISIKRMYDIDELQKIIKKKYGNRKDFDELIDKALSIQTPEKVKLIKLKEERHKKSNAKFSRALGIFPVFAWKSYAASLPFSVLAIVCFLLWKEDTSIKQEIILRPKKFIFYCSISFLGLLAYAIDSDSAVRIRYWKARSEFLKRKGYDYRPTEDDEEFLWTAANLPVKKFDEALKMVFRDIPYEAIQNPRLAFATTLAIWILSFPLFLPKKSFAVEQAAIVQTASCEEARKLARILLDKGIITEKELAKILKQEETAVPVEENRTKTSKNDDAKPQISGIVRARFSSTNNQINIPNAWLKFSGVWNGIGFELRPDFSSNKTDKNRLMRANITLPLMFGSYLKEVSFGKIFDPASDQFPDPFLLRTIDYSKASTLPDDVGVVFRGEFGPASYQAAIVNGNGFFEMSDDNSSKDFSGRLLLNMKKFIKSDYFDELTVGAIMKRGKQPEPIGMREIFGGDFSVRAGPFWLNGGMNRFNDSVLETNGWWLLTTYDLPYGLQPVFQLDALDNERNVLGGLNWLIRKDTEFKLNVIRHLNSSFPMKKYELLLQIQQRF